MWLCLMDGGRGTPSSPGGGEGVPLGTPHCPDLIRGVHPPPSRPSRGGWYPRYPLSSRPGIGYPQPRPEMRYPPPRPWMGYPPHRPGTGYPPRKCEQTKNITFPHPSDAGGKYYLLNPSDASGKVFALSIDFTQCEGALT